MSCKIGLFDYLSTLPEINEKLTSAFNDVLYSGQLVLGPQTHAFEEEFAAWLGAKQCVAVSSGTTALHLALLGVGVQSGDEVITVANTCAPTIAAIRLCGATPVFVDVDPQTLMMDLNLIESACTDRTKVIVPVHLWGMCVDMDRLMSIAKSKRLKVVEDCAQAHGTLFKNTSVGLFGDAGCFSFYPTKNIGAFGDAGAIVSNDESLLKTLKAKRMYGYDASGVSQEEGMNARIHELQAAFLRVRLQQYTTSSLSKRRKNAQLYGTLLPTANVAPIPVPQHCLPTYHQYVIRTDYRSELIDHLTENDITCGIHYAIPVHKHPGYNFLHSADTIRLPITESACDEILSLPVHEGLSPKDIERVVRIITTFKPCEL